MHDHAITQRQIPAILPSNREVFVRAPMRPVGVFVRHVADVALDALMLLAIILSIPSSSWPSEYRLRSSCNSCS
jgi:hypothetical protein